MPEGLLEEESQLRRAVRELAARFDDNYWAEHDRDEVFPWDFYKAFAAAGWLGISIPEDYGGGGLGVEEAGIVLEEIAASGAGINGCSALHLTIFGLHPVIKHGSEELKQRILPRAVSGEMHVSFAVTEPNSGSDTPSIETVARKKGGVYHVSGQKVWISKAQEAEKVILLARTTPMDQSTKRTEGMTLFLADLDAASVDIHPIAKMGRNAVDSNELFIDDLVVPQEDRIGEEGMGFRYLLDGLNAERILFAYEAVGLGHAAINAAVRYANERVVFGRPVGSNQGIQFPLAEALIELEAGSLMAKKAALLYDSGQPCGKEANMAKFLCSEASFHAADRAVQTLGGFGYAKQFHVERYFREARLLKIVPVSQELVLAYVAAHVLGLPRSY